MAGPSSIDKLPKEARERLRALLDDPAVSQIDATDLVNALLEQMGLEQRVSKSAVNRYAKKIEDIGKKLKESREVAEVLITKVGATPAGDVGKLLNEIIRTLAFESLVPMMESEEKATPKMLANLALMIQRLEKAAMDNEKTTAEIKRQAREEALEAVEKITKQGGMSKETVNNIKNAILGVKDD